MALPNIWSRNHLIRDAICAAIHQAMREDPRVTMLGEGALIKTHFDAPQIEHDFASRVLTLPISEDSNTNFAVGLAIAGLVPVVDVISSDFLYRTMDAICNTAAKTPLFRSEPTTMVIRSEFFTGGPSTGQRIESLFTHIPGLNVVVPSNPADAYGLMATALRTPGVTVFFEDRMIEDATTPESTMAAGDNDYWVSLGAAYIRKRSLSNVRGSCKTMSVASYGLTVRLLDGWLADTPYELIDLRTLYPLDIETLIESVSRTGGLLFVEPDVRHAGVGAEVIAQIAEMCPGTRVARLGAPRITIPTAREHHEKLLPTRERVLAKAAEMAR